MNLAGIAFEPLYALTVFALVTSITPGPNNLMLLASGVNFGFKKTMPHMVGISIGFGVMLFAVALGFMQIFKVLPWLQNAMKWMGVAYLLWMALGLVRESFKSKTPEQTEGSPTITQVPTASGALKPMSFLAAAAFQWINPKAWWMAMSVCSTYLPLNPSVVLVLLVSTIFVAVNLPTVSLWTLIGSQLKSWLKEPAKLRLFNCTMAFLLVASLYPIIFEAK